jgi:hypothetical protein
VAVDRETRDSVANDWADVMAGDYFGDMAIRTNHAMQRGPIQSCHMAPWIRPNGSSLKVGSICPPGESNSWPIQTPTTSAQGANHPSYNIAC